MEGAVIGATLTTVDDKHREVQRILVGWWVFLISVDPSGQASRVLAGALRFIKTAAPTSPEAASARTVQSSQGEATPAEGDTRTAVADAKGAAGKYGGAADGAVAAFTVLPDAS